MTLNPIKKLEPLERGVFKIVAFCVFLTLVCGALGLALSAQSNANKAQFGLHGSCQFWRDLSDLPLPANSTKVAFSIVADSRVAYTRQSCDVELGALPAPDPRVLPYLPPSMR
ncbi:MAG TPA: hypothetical protein VGH54_21560 [Mycobacterium sp.]|jgi:hypothetical protein|uniref:hypothetical protein n=1 Tax=Mycobacterium sp. TaxID=1785 RepID=UPI002F4184F4